MKKLLIAGIFALLVIVAGAVVFVSQQTEAAAEAAPVAVRSPAASGVVAEGAIVPLRFAALSSQASGLVAELLVNEGDQVEAGAVILRLEGAREAAAVAQALAALERAEARLAELQAGPRAEEIAVAEAALTAAQAQLARAAQGARAEDVAGGEAAVAAAQASLSRLLEGATPGALAAARAEAANAEAAVAQAQAAYDRVSGNPDVGASREGLALQQATNAFEAARARLADLERGASRSDIDGARARLSQAQAQLAAIKAAARPADLAVADAEVRRAESQLALVRAGARPESIAAAKADVASAQAALVQARALLSQTEVRAPFAGVIAELRVQVGESVTPATPLAVVADLSAWRVETTDLTELDVARVQVGDSVRLAVDALPDVALTGVVERIGDVGESKKGDVSYTIVVRPNEDDSRLKWNMTVAATFAGE